MMRLKSILVLFVFFALTQARQRGSRGSQPSKEETEKSDREGKCKSKILELLGNFSFLSFQYFPCSLSSISRMRLVKVRILCQVVQPNTAMALAILQVNVDPKADLPKDLVRQDSGCAVSLLKIRIPIRQSTTTTPTSKTPDGPQPMGPLIPCPTPSTNAAMIFVGCVSISKLSPWYHLPIHRKWQDTLVVISLHLLCLRDKPSRLCVET